MRQLLHYGILPCLLCILFSSCSDKQAALPILNGKDALKNVSEIYSIGPKPSGSAGARKACEHICKEISAIGLVPETDEWKQVDALGMETTYRNISATIPGRSARFIIIGSHYDTKRLETVPDFAGANDGASSSGLLLSVMKAIKDSGQKPPFTLKFVFFDGEECLLNYSEKDGLTGSRRLSSLIKESGKVKDCRAVVVMDMVGDRDLDISIPDNSSPELTSEVQRIAGERGWKKFFSSRRSSILDDHVPFFELGIPAIDIIDYNYGENNRYWHTAGDTIDKISPESLEIAGRLLIELLFSLK